jgi:hypothetical protein
MMSRTLAHSRRQQRAALRRGDSESVPTELVYVDRGEEAILDLSDVAFSRTRR